MRLYGVVNVDIVKSRNIKNRQDTQDKLRDIIGNLNKKYANDLASPITITLGDEFQAVLANPSQCYNLIHDVQTSLWEGQIDIYSGFGIGKLSTMPNEDVRMMDGPCFHMAREAINIAKRAAKEKNKAIHSKRNRIYFKEDKSSEIDLPGISNNSAYETIKETAAAFEINKEDNFRKRYSMGDIINVLIENNEILKNKLTDKQKQAYMDYAKYGSYRKILEAYSENEHESIGAISQRMNNAEYFTIQRNYDMVVFLLDLYCTLRGGE